MKDDLGNPIARARVFVWGRGAEMEARSEVATDAAGAFSIPVPAGRYTVGISAEKHSSKSQEVIVEDGAPVTLDFALDRAGSVSGRITLADGQPLMNTTVRVRFRRGTGYGGTSPRTGADGSYRATCREPGTCTVEVKAPRYALVSAPGVRIARGEEVTGLDFVLDATAASVSGIVYDSDGKTPKPDAYVWAQKLQGDGREMGFGGLSLAFQGRPQQALRFSEFPNGQAGPNGEFLLDDIEEGTYRVYAQAAGYAASPADTDTAVARSQTMTGVVVVLRRAAVVSGTVYGTDGKPLANTSLNAGLEYSREAGSRGSYGVGVQTDDRGRYSIEPLEPGSYDLRLSAEGVGAATKRFAITGAEQLTDLDFRLAAGATLSALVLEPNGQPAQGAEASLWRVVGGGRHGGPALTVDERGEVRFHNVDDGNYELEVRSVKAAPGFEGGIAIAGGQGREVMVQLREGASITGRVVDEAGNAIAGARVGADCWEPAVGIGHGVMGDERQTPTTGDDGRFMLRHLVAGTWSLSVRARGHLQSDASVPVEEEGKHEVQIVLPKGWSGTLQGQVLMDDGKTPIANAALTVRLIVRQPGGYHGASASTDGEGRFELEVDTGVQAMRFEAKGWLPTTVEIAPSDRPTETVTLQMLRPAGIRGTVEIGDAAIPPEGLYVLAVRPGDTVNMRDIARPRDERPVATFMPGFGTIQSGGPRLREGDYEQGFALLKPGEWEWQITELETGEFDVFTYAGGMPPSVPRRVTLRAGETAEVVVDVAIAGSVAGRVVTAEEAPIVGARVYADTAGGRVSEYSPRAETDADGRFRLDGLTPGAAGIRVSATGYAIAPAQQVTVLAREVVANLELRMLKGGTITGVVRRQGGGAPGGNYRVRLDMGLVRYRVVYPEVDGTFRFERVYPGTYSLLVQTRDTQETIAKRDGIAVADEQTVGGIEFVIEPRQ